MSKQLMSSFVIRLSLCVAIVAVSYIEIFRQDNVKASLGKVGRIRWSVERPFAKYLEQQATPLILENTVVSSWDALSKWNTVDKLAHFIQGSRLENIFHHRVGSGTIFGPFYDANRPFSRLDNVKPENPYSLNGRLTIKEVMRVFGEEFEYSCVNESLLSPSHLSGCWAYSGGVMDTVGNEDMLEPLDELLVLNPSASSINLWVGQRGVTTPCHFDGYHNM
jgi:hypothetical protein